MRDTGEYGNRSYDRGQRWVLKISLDHEQMKSDEGILKRRKLE